MPDMSDTRDERVREALTKVVEGLGGSLSFYKHSSPSVKGLYSQKSMTSSICRVERKIDLLIEKLGYQVNTIPADTMELVKKKKAKKS